MKKEVLVDFIKRYHLNSLISSTIWEIKKDKLSSRFKNEEGNLVGFVDLNGFENLHKDYELGIPNSDLFLKLLGVLKDDITFNVESVIRKEKEKHLFIDLSDGFTKIKYKLAEPQFLKRPRMIKNIDFDFEIKLEKEFINTFIKSKGAFSNDVNEFAILEGDDKIDIIVNYSNISTTNIKFTLYTKIINKISTPLIFNINYFKEILNINKNAEEIVMSVNNHGVCIIKVKDNNLNLKYVLTKTI